jgi:hypothetical protein
VTSLPLAVLLGSPFAVSDCALVFFLPSDLDWRPAAAKTGASFCERRETFLAVELGVAVQEVVGQAVEPAEAVTGVRGSLQKVALQFRTLDGAPDDPVCESRSG